MSSHLGPGYKTFFMLSTKFILLINVNLYMPTIVGILTFISMINTTSERLKARNFFTFQYFSFYEQLKIWCSVELRMKKVITSGPGLGITKPIEI